MTSNEYNESFKEKWHSEKEKQVREYLKHETNFTLKYDKLGNTIFELKKGGGLKDGL